MAINQQREDHTRLGFGCSCVRSAIWGSRPMTYARPCGPRSCVAPQLEVPPEFLQAYGHWIPTRTTHLQQVQTYLISLLVQAVPQRSRACPTRP